MEIDVLDLFAPSAVRLYLSELGPELGSYFCANPKVTGLPNANTNATKNFFIRPPHCAVENKIDWKMGSSFAFIHFFPRVLPLGA
jgi:hypothetical protein